MIGIREWSGGAMVLGFLILVPGALLYVVLALLGQAAVGIAIVRSETLPGALGWATTAWNVAWLLILFSATRAEVYFPVLHHVMPLAIGSVLIFGGGDRETAA